MEKRESEIVDIKNHQLTYLYKISFFYINDNLFNE